MVADSPCFDWSSSVMSSSFRPRTPPAALISSIASAVPLCDDWPNAASLPVSEAYSPILMVSWARAAADRAAAARAAVRGRERRAIGFCVPPANGSRGTYSTEVGYNLIKGARPASIPGLTTFDRPLLREWLTILALGLVLM